MDNAISWDYVSRLGRLAKAGHFNAADELIDRANRIMLENALAEIRTMENDIAEFSGRLEG